MPSADRSKSMSMCIAAGSLGHVHVACQHFKAILIYQKSQSFCDYSCCFMWRSQEKCVVSRSFLRMPRSDAEFARKGYAYGAFKKTPHMGVGRGALALAVSVAWTSIFVAVCFGKRAYAACGVVV